MSKAYKTFILFTLAVILIFTFATAEARTFCKDSLSVGTLLFSKHAEERGWGKEWNEKQGPSLLGQCNGWMVGFYQNSYSTEKQQLTSWLFAKNWNMGSAGPLKFSLTAGVVSGYPDKYSEERWQDRRVTEKRWMPWGSINAKVSIFKVYWVPTAVTGFGLEWEF